MPSNRQLVATTTDRHLSRVPRERVQVNQVGRWFSLYEGGVLGRVVYHGEDTSDVGGEFTWHPTDERRRLILIKLEQKHKN